MKTKLLLVLGLLTAGIVSAAGVYIEYFSDPLVSDQYLLDRFESDREFLEKIRARLDENSTINMVCCSVECRKRTSESQEAMTQELCTLLDAVDSTWVDRALTDEGSAIFVRVDGRYLGVNEDGGGVSALKGYAYSTYQPARLLESLDGWGYPHHQSFRKVTDNWYISYRVSSSKPE